MQEHAARRGPGAIEVVVSLVVYAGLTALLFPGVVFGDRTVASAPHIAFTLPEGPYRLATDHHTATIPLIDPWGPGQIHEANFPYRDRAIRAGEVPLWNPHEACGNPYLAGLLPGLFYPPSYLMHLLPPTRGFDLAYLARLVLAGWLLFLFLRVHGLRLAAAFLGGAAFLASGFLVISLNTSNTDVVTMSPGLLLALECVARRGRRGPFVLAALMVFLVLVGGNPQSSLLALLVGGAYFVARVSTGPRGDRAVRLVRGALAGLVGLLLAAPQLLPFLEFVEHGAHLEHAGFARFHAPWLTLPAWVVPDYYRDALAGVAARRTLFYHAGALPVVLAIAALVLPGRRFLKGFAAGVLAVLGLWHFGAPGVRLLGELPALSQIQAAKYPAAHLCLMISVLAGVGLDRLPASSIRRGAAALIAGGLVAAAVPLGFWVAWRVGWLEHFATAALRLAPGAGTGPHFGALPFVIAGTLVVAAGLLLAPRRRPAAIALIGFGLLAELAAHIPHACYPRGGDPYQRPPFLEAIEGDPRTFRVFSPDGVLMPNTAGAFGLNDIRYVEALKVERYARLIFLAFDYLLAADYFPAGAGERLTVPPRTLGLLGVRYVLTRGDPTPLPVSRLACGVRKEISLPLGQGPGRLRGRLRAAGPGVAAVRFMLMDGSTNRLVATGAIPSRPGAEVRLVGDPAGLDSTQRACLILPTPAAGPVVIEALHWGGQPLDLADLAGGAGHGKARFRAETGVLEIRRLPAIIYLPPLQPGRPAEAVLRAHGTGGGPTSVALALAAGRVLGEVRADPNGAIDIDLTEPAGRDRVVSVESLGPEVVAFERLRLDHDALHAVGEFDGVRVFENRAALPRAYGVYRAEVVGAQIERLLDPQFRARDVVILDRLPEPWRPPDPVPGTSPVVTWIEERPGGALVRLRVEFPAEGLLVLTDNHYPGWVAAVDGRPADLLRANFTFRAVPVPPGTHEVVFRYRPASLAWGLVLAGVGLVILGGFLALRRP